MVRALDDAISGKGQARVNGAGLRVRLSDSLAGEVLGKLDLAEVVTIWAVVGEWALIQSDDGRLTGWASLAYLTPIGEFTP